MKTIKPLNLGPHTVPNFVIRDGQLKLYGSEEEFTIEGFGEDEPVAVISFEHLKRLRLMQLRTQALHKYHAMENQIRDELCDQLTKIEESWKSE